MNAFILGNCFDNQPPVVEHFQQKFSSQSACCANSNRTVRLEKEMARTNVVGGAIKSKIKISSVLEDKQEAGCCRCARQRKGAWLTLLWSFSAFSVFHFIVKVYNNTYVDVDYKYYDGIVACTVALFIPLAGWIGDVYFGRYKVIKYSLWLLWVCAVVMCLLHNFTTPPVGIGVNIAYSFLIMALLVGLTAFQCSIIQFGIDQLYNSSSYEIVSYIVYYTWTFNASEVVVQFTQVCFCDQYHNVTDLLLPFLLTLSLCCDFLFGHWLVKEPATHNPLKLIYKVLQYAMKNKHPRLRSAFTYWDHKPYSRLDLGKEKYGGPFTTEQVEDVKTFFRMSVVIAVLSLFIGMLLHGSDTITKVNFYFSENVSCPSTVSSLRKYTRECFERLLIGNAGEIFITLFLPLYQVFFLRLFWNCMSQISILKKSGVSLGVLLICILWLLGIQLADDISKLDAIPQGANSTKCVLNDDLAVPYNIMLVGPSMLAGIGESLLLTTSIEFVSAQAPYSMKGILFGIIYIGITVSLFSAYILTLVFSTVPWDGVVLDCGFWFLLVCTVITLLLIAMFLVASRWYRKRERDENLPSQHWFAEQYYDHSFETEASG